MKKRLHPKLITREEYLKERYPDIVKRREILAAIEKEKAAILARYNKKLGHDLRQAREAIGATQESVAKKLHTKASNISRIENGRQNLTIEYLVKYCKVVGVPVEISINGNAVGVFRK